MKKKSEFPVRSDALRHDANDDLAVMKNRLFQEAVAQLNRTFGDVSFDAAVVLGSGLGGFSDHLAEKTIVSTTEIPGYPSSTVAGHRGEIIGARIGDKRVLVFRGRVHYYETAATIDSAVTAIVSHHLGIKTIVLTNAAGILNESFYPGDLMLIKDQINFTFRNVLRDMGADRVILGDVYDPELSGTAFTAAEKAGVNLRSGVYLGLTGPSYETAAEVKAYRAFGGDAVGMSTIQEALYARSVGMRVAGISCLTNYSTGITSKPLSHTEVTEISRQVDAKFSRLLVEFISSI